MNTHRNALHADYLLHWYRIKRVLGHGGFGITYLAEDTNLHRLVAIKEYMPGELAVRDSDMSVLPVSTSCFEKYQWGLQRFFDEARLLSSFNHPNIVRVQTVMQQNNTAYMVMDYEDGEGLNALLKREKTMNEDRLRRLLRPVLDGLEHVHAAGVIHRDLKPANLFIRADGTPVLLDFGSARQALGRRTRTLTALVSPGFAPFEQYSGNGELQGPWTDIYGLGGMLYRVATGRAPADAMDRSQALLTAGRDLYVSAAEIRPHGYSMSFLHAIDHALCFRAADRPQNIAAWREEFDRSPAPVSAPSRRPRVPAPSRRVPALLADAETALNVTSAAHSFP